MGKTYSDGLTDAWELARKLYCEKNTYDLIEIFGIEYENYSGSIIYSKVLKNLTPQEALAKIESYEESKAIKVGDVVVYPNNSREYVVINTECNKAISTDLLDSVILSSSGWKKTGRHIDIQHILEQIRGNE